MTRARDIAFIRKLCGLGLPAQALAQTLLPALRGLIPSHSGGVFWVDAKGELTHLYAERMLPSDAMAAYHERHYQQNREGFAAAFRRRSQAPDPISYHTFTRAEQDTPYFRDVMGRLDAYHVLYGVLRDGSRAVAQVSFYRGRSDEPFDKANAETLRSVLRYVTAGFARPPGAPAPDEAMVIVEEDLGIVSPDGALISAPENWLRLVRLLALGEVSPRNAKGEAATVERFLRQLCETLPARTGNGGVPRLTYDTAWGRFLVHVFRLADAKGRRADQVGLLVRREEPRMVSLIRGAGNSALSPQQREVALLLARNRSNREIAQDLGLSLNTASYHVKQVFARLGVNDRSAVSGRLLALAEAGPHA